MSSLDRFADSMLRRARQVDDGRARLLREVGLRIDQTVVLGTPVDTGRARSNWIVEFNASPRSTRDAFFPTIALNSSALTLLNQRFSERQNAQAAIAEAAGKLASVRPGDTIFIVNNLPYIGPLADGLSPQAPPGYVRTAIAEAIASLSNVRLLAD